MPEIDSTRLAELLDIEKNHNRLNCAFDILGGEHRALEIAAANSHHDDNENSEKFRKLHRILFDLNLVAERGVEITVHGEECHYNAPFADPVLKGDACKCSLGCFMELFEGTKKAVDIVDYYDYKPTQKNQDNHYTADVWEKMYYEKSRECARSDSAGLQCVGEIAELKSRVRELEAKCRKKEE